MATMNREAWLTEVASRIVPLFRGVEVKPFRVTCGWPSVNGLGGRSRRIGECWYGKESADGVHNIFVSPVIDKPGGRPGSSPTSWSTSSPGRRPGTARTLSGSPATWG